jgi:hypothetical protein
VPASVVWLNASVGIRMLPRTTRVAASLRIVKASSARIVRTGADSLPLDQ